MQTWRQIYWNRTRKHFVDGLTDILKMTGADPPSRAPHTLFTFNSHDDLRMYATGCDADIGGNSTVNLDLDLDEASTPHPHTHPHTHPHAHTHPHTHTHTHNARTTHATAKFWGDMRLDVRPQYQGRVRGGYAAFRNKPRPTLFGDILDNIEFHEYLALRLRVSGDPITHNSYFVNLQTNGPITTDVWQHRLFFRRKDEWEDVFIPFRNFVRTNNGELSEIQLEMSPHLRSVGISLLGGNSAVSGKYQLNIDSIRIVNEEDAVSDLDSSGSDEKEEKGQTWEDIKI
ncbi:complex I intermediate-associated protein 30-domain-containing protein [Lentinula edodes]|nr:complex I intermediate-associated protein 30-domain-containing protein [Lentinula edodes]